MQATEALHDSALAAATTVPTLRSKRYRTLDLLRALIRVMLVSAGFGLGGLAKRNPALTGIASQLDHFAWARIALWGLIRQAVKFMVGVAARFVRVQWLPRGARERQFFRHVAARSQRLIRMLTATCSGRALLYPLSQCSRHEPFINRIGRAPHNQLAGRRDGRTALKVMVVAVAGAAGWVGEIKGAEPLRVVTVCMERAADLHMERGADIQLIPLAQAMGSRMFAAARVRIDWRGARGCPDSAIFISLSADPHNRQHPGALAYALPYEGIHIVIFCDRVQKVIEPAGVPYVMAHVLVHEVTHLLQRVPRHSGNGVMKAEWTAKDYAQMYSQPLPFTVEGIALIQSSVDARNWPVAAPH